MSRYFIELAYKGTAYSGFQIQENAHTVQSEVEKAFAVLHRQPITLTGSSRTDAGVHALQNYFHFDFEEPVHSQFIYKMNAILPEDIVVRRIIEMPARAHSRFDAISRAYEYHIHCFKDPFLKNLSLYYPYKLDWEAMQEAAGLVRGQHNFFAFCKTNTQVRNFECRVIRCGWERKGEGIVFQIEANRFLRGMVRLLTASILKVGRGKITSDQFKKLIEGRDKCGISVPAHGLFLKEVAYPENYFPVSGVDLGGF